MSTRHEEYLSFVEFTASAFKAGIEEISNSVSQAELTEAQRQEILASKCYVSCVGRHMATWSVGI